MFSNLPVQILLLVPIVTSYRIPRATGCTRVFHFDFERRVSRGEGGIWQGQVGEVKFKDGKAWFYGNGSLTYPFFSHNDLRPSFAFSFKVKPSKSHNHGDRVAIITNGVSPGSSTLTVFHNETCVGVKVTETAEPRVWTQSRSSSRDVELSVKYYNQNKRMRRSSERGESLSYKRHSGAINYTSNSPDADENGDSFIDLRREEDNRANTTANKEKIAQEDVIAVRRLFRQNGPTFISRADRVEDSYARTTTSTTEDPILKAQDSDDSDQAEDSNQLTTTLSPLGVLSSYIVNPFQRWRSRSQYGRQEQTTVSSAEILVQETSTSSVNIKNSHISVPFSSFVVKPARQRMPTNFQSVLTSGTSSKDSEETSESSKPEVVDRVLIVPYVFRQTGDDEAEEVKIRIAQTNGVLSLQVGDSAVKKTNVGSTEHMKAPRSALRVGAGDGLLSYRGSFDEFIMYDCPPADFFKKTIPPSSRTSAFVWSSYLPG